MPAFQNPQRGPFARHGEACDDPSAAERASLHGFISLATSRMSPHLRSVY